MTFESSAEQVPSPKTAPSEVSLGFILRYWVADIGVFLTIMTPVMITLAIRVADLFPENKAACLGIIAAAGSLASMVANPVCGHLSDITVSRFGRRRPWMACGMVVALIGLAGLGIATSLVGLVVAWIITQVGVNATLASLTALIPERVPKSQRGLVSSLHSMSTTVAIMSGVVVVNLTGTEGMPMFILPGLIGMAALLLLVVTLHEPGVQRHQRGQHPNQPAQPRGKPAGYRALLHEHDFILGWVNTFVLFFGSSMVGTYQVYYLTDVLGYDALAVAHSIFVSSVLAGGCVILASSVSGWLSDRLNRRRPFIYLAAALFAVGIAVLVITESFAGFLAAIAITSFATAIYATVGQAMIVDVLPGKDESAGRNLGIFNIAVTSPQAIGPVVAPLILSLGGGGNYNALFITAGIIVLVSVIPVTLIRSVR